MKVKVMYFDEFGPFAHTYVLVFAVLYSCEVTNNLKHRDRECFIDVTCQLVTDWDWAVQRTCPVSPAFYSPL